MTAVTEPRTNVADTLYELLVSLKPTMSPAEYVNTVQRLGDYCNAESMDTLIGMGNGIADFCDLNSCPGCPLCEDGKPPF